MVILFQGDLTRVPLKNINFCNNTQNKYWVLKKIKEKPTTQFHKASQLMNSSFVLEPSKVK